MSGSRGRHDLGCQCWPHVSESEAIDNAVEAARQEYREGIRRADRAVAEYRKALAARVERYQRAYWRVHSAYDGECEHGFGPPATNCPNDDCPDRELALAFAALIEQDTPPAAPTVLLRCSACGIAVTHEHGGLKHGTTAATLARGPVEPEDGWLRCRCGADWGPLGCEQATGLLIEVGERPSWANPPVAPLDVERLAAIEHDQWMTWARSVMSADDVTIGPERLARWRSYMVPYADLPESVKEHDRVWARQVAHVCEAQP